MDLGKSIKFDQSHTSWIKSFICGLVDLPLGFAVLKYLDKLIFKLEGVVFRDGPVSVLVAN